MATPVTLTDYTKIPTTPGASPLTSDQSKDTFWSSNPISSYIIDTYRQIHSHRQSLSLTNPGSVEDLNKEVSRDVFLNQYFFTGLRADLNKAFSLNPAFQTSHTFSIGSNNLPVMHSPLYSPMMIYLSKVMSTLTTHYLVD